MPNPGIEPWMHDVFELIQEGTELLGSGTDAGKRGALIKFDQAIEQSIKTFAMIPSALRYGRELPPDQRKKAESTLYDSKMEFLEWYLSETGRELPTPITSIRFYHSLRNKSYHDSNGMVPGLAHVFGAQNAAIQVFGALFGDQAAEAARTAASSAQETVTDRRPTANASTDTPWAAPIRKPTSQSRKWSSDDVLAALRGNVKPASLAALKRLIAWTTEHGGSPGTGSGAAPSISAWMQVGDAWVSTWSCYAQSRTLVINFGTLVRKVSRERVEALATDLRAIPGVTAYLAGLEGSSFSKYPALPLDEVVARRGTINAIELALERLVSSPPTGGPIA